MAKLIQSADGILHWLAERRRPVAESLRVGLSDMELRDFEKALDWRLPQEAKDLFRWRNGVRVPQDGLLDDIYFFPGYYLLSVSEALEHMGTHVELGLWPRQWFPIFGSGGGDFHVLDCGRGDERSSPVVWFIRGEPKHWDSYVSLTTMMDSLAEGFAEGALYVDEAGFLEMDERRYAPIARKHNPDLELWRQGAESRG
jgi:cell wall assembly regulator SMI1